MYDNVSTQCKCRLFWSVSNFENDGSSGDAHEYGFQPQPRRYMYIWMFYWKLTNATANSTKCNFTWMHFYTILHKLFKKTVANQIVRLLLYLLKVRFWNRHQSADPHRSGGATWSSGLHRMTATVRLACVLHWAADSYRWPLCGTWSQLFFFIPRNIDFPPSLLLFSRIKTIIMGSGGHTVAECHAAVGLLK